MLTNKTIVFLLVVLLQLLVVLHFTNTSLREHDREYARAGLLSGHLGLVSDLHIQTGNFSAKLTRNNTQWIFAPPAAGRADSQRINLLLDTITHAIIHERISTRVRENRELDLADFGLRNPRATLTLAGNAKSALPVILRFGNETPSGECVYLQTEGSSDILVIERAAFDLIPSDLDNLRKRTLFREEDAPISSIEIRRPDKPTVRLEANEAGVWSIATPFKAPASAPTVAALLEHLENATVHRFLWAPDGSQPEKKENLASRTEQARIAHGLSVDETVLFLTVTHRNVPTPTEFVFGKPDPTSPGDVLAASLSGGFVCTVDRILLDALLLPLNDLRERSIFPFVKEDLIQVSFLTTRGPFTLERADTSSEWNIRRPARQPADSTAVNAFLDSLLGLLDDSASPMAPDETIPLHAVRVDLKPSPFPDAGHTPSSQRSFWVTATSTNPPLVTISDPENRLHHTLTGTKAEALDFSDATYAALRSPHILSLLPSSIETISRSADGATQTVQRRADGAWFTHDQQPAYANSAAADEIAALAGNFTAFDVATLFTADSAAYGLLSPAIEITIETGIPERPIVILQLGDALPDGSHYLRIKGENTVFIITADAAHTLSTPLVSRTPL